MKFAILLALLATSFALPGRGVRQRLTCVPGSTVRVCQLTGDFDRAAGRPTLSLTNKRFGIIGSDLGSTFEHRGRLYFLFGDTVGKPGDRDAIGWTESRDPDRIRLDFHRDADGKWSPPNVSGISQGAFEIPSGGISIRGAMYVGFTAGLDGKKMGRSVLARSRDDGRTFETLFEVSRARFINLSFLESGEWVYIFGSGEYRRSCVYLARVRPRDIEERSKWEFLGAPDTTAAPAWKRAEDAAQPLFDHPVVGEFSVAYISPMRKFVMLYNSVRPRGITMRSAATPWGPWSDGTVIFDPWRDRGYGHFIHQPARPGQPGDNLEDPGREREYGGEYGPYLMARYTRGAAAGCAVYYTMSTWNPYQVVVMRSDLKWEPCD